MNKFFLYQNTIHEIDKYLDLIILCNHCILKSNNDSEIIESYNTFFKKFNENTIRELPKTETRSQLSRIIANNYHSSSLKLKILKLIKDKLQKSIYEYIETLSNKLPKKVYENNNYHTIRNYLENKLNDLLIEDVPTENLIKW